MVRNSAIPTKHIYAGTTRIASKRLSGGNATNAPTAWNNTNKGNGGNPNGLSTATATTTTTAASTGTPGQGLINRSAQGNANAQNTVNNPNLTGVFPGQGLTNRSQQGNANAQNTIQNPNLNGTGIGGGTGNGNGGNPNGGGNANNAWQPEIEFLYFYHPDHLGSTSYVTDQNGKLYEHIQYFPFGESWIEEGPTTRKTPYLFTSKEYDPETGLYYFGARYYDPRTSVWQSADPILGVLVANEARLDELSRKLSAYSYSRQNPILFRDPDGRDYEVLVGGPYKDHPYGHVALRVFGDGYDVTYDFGRYHGGGATGEGVLRTWNNSFKNYVASENKLGRTTTGYEFKTSPQQDKATMETFSKLMASGKKDKTDPRGFSEFLLKDQYHALTNNCTTMCLLGVNSGSPELAGTLGDPKESKGRGLSGLEKFLAGDAVGKQIFMPQDLQENIEKAKSFSKRHEYKTGNPSP